MNSIKVSLSIKLQGGVLESEEMSSKNINKIVLTDRKTHKKETVIFYTRGCIPATQSLKINKKSYLYMIGKYNCPEWEKKFVWSKMNNTQRLESHLKRIVESLNGLSYSYDIIDD